MGNPFFPPAPPPSQLPGAHASREARVAGLMTLAVCLVWLAVSAAVLLLTLSDYLAAGSSGTAEVAELE